MYKIQLSPYHKIFYNEWKLDQNSSKYHLVFDQNISSSLDIKRLRSSLKRLISDYLILNSHVNRIDDELFWVENNQIATLDYFDGKYDQERILNFISQPFNTEENALYRFAVFSEPDGSYRFILVFHHILMDGNSFKTLISEISNYYNAPRYTAQYSLLEQETLLLESTQIYNERLEQFNLQYHDFWNKKLNDVEATDLRWAKSEIDIDRIKEHRFSFTDEIMAKLIPAIKKLNISSYVFSQCIFVTLLNKYTSQNRISFSYPVKIKGGIPLISGVCINTNINTYEFNATTTIIDLFQQNHIQTSQIKNENSYYYPINDIIDNSNKNILQIMFNKTNLKNSAFNFNNAETNKINDEFNIDLPTRLIFELEVENNLLNFSVRYNILHIDETILTNFIAHYKLLFLNILNDLCSGITNKPLKEYMILSEKEYNKILYNWNSNDSYCESNKSIQELFEAQVTKTPDNIALVFEDVKLTYSELNYKANQFASFLRITHNPKPDELIALYMNRGIYMLISILGSLKAGVAYVPIDTTHPEERICYILNDTRAKVIITNNHNYNYLSNLNTKNTNIAVIAIDSSEIECILNEQKSENLKLNTKGNNLAYVMYTSGTTGKPKGVMLEQNSVAIRIISMIEKSGITSNCRYLFKTNYIFDVSFSDIFITLLSGAALYITKSVFDIEEIYNLITTNDINICHFVPSQLDAINNYLYTKDIFTKLRIIHLSGEKFNKSLIYENTNIKYVNYYGPTEAGEVSCDITDFKNHLSDHLKIDTIGYPLNQSTLYVLDNNLNVLPIGAIGELYIGGSGLARAYLNLPELTQKTFIQNPFQTINEKLLGTNLKLYKTGDLVRYLPNGNIEYIGRNDTQVKIRGYRIELGEIETKLLTYPKIKQCVVLANGQTNSSIQFLAAYYVADAKIDENLILDYLSEMLPDYMVPSTTIYLDKLPLTKNGKLDIKALPKAVISTNNSNYLAPRNEAENKICKVFADILKLSIHQIGVNENFFRLGGNSISAIHLAFKLQISVNDIFEYKTPAKIAQLLTNNNSDLTNKLEQIKLIYLRLALEKETNYDQIKLQQQLYKEQIQSYIFDSKVRPTSKVLLTGGTGYLGCHVLYELLTTTNHIIYLPVRANKLNEASYTRLYNKFKYYFDIDLNIYVDRIKVFTSDISKTNIGIDNTLYSELVDNISSIIHTAALVKHYGSNSEFYQENVQSTINLLELCKLTSNKDFHYISTIGVFTNLRVTDSSYNIFTEDHIDEKKANLDNIYTKTKYQSEQSCIKYQDYGVKTSIYRVGNLAINSTTNKTQENVDDNAFLQRIKTISKLGIIPKEIFEVEISPVDYTARAITLLFNQIGLSNQIYHVFNPNKYNLYKLLGENKSTAIKQVTLTEFIDVIATQLKNNIDIDEIQLFMLHQWWLQPDISNLAKIFIFQNKAEYLLDKLHFKWPDINQNILSNLIKNC